MEFRDKCVIERPTDRSDEWDNQILETIYEGECHYEEGGQSNVNRMVIRNPLLFLPSNKVLVNINDSVSIVTFTGRKVTSIVKAVRDIRFTFMERETTRIELKQASEE